MPEAAPRPHSESPSSPSTPSAPPAGSDAGPTLTNAVRLTGDAAQELAGSLAATLDSRGWTVATAESLTGGTIASVLAAAPGATDWFRGSVVSYSPTVKFGLLGVEPGPVVTRDTALTMARSTARLLEADLCVAVTGVGGPDPDPDEDEPAGAVWFAVVTPDDEHAEKVVFEQDDPVEVLAATTQHALRLLQDAGPD